MGQAIALPAGAGEKVVTGVGAFGTGVTMSFITKSYPAAGIMGNILLGAGGLLVALMTRGMVADFFEGVGAGGLAILGSSIAWLPEAATAGKGRPLTKEIQKGGQKITLQLAGGAATATGELAARAARATSVLEF